MRGDVTPAEVAFRVINHKMAFPLCTHLTQVMFDGNRLLDNYPPEILETQLPR